MAALHDLTIQESHTLLRSGQVSSVELTRACLDRIRKVEPKIKAFVTVTEDEAMRMARRADKERLYNNGSPLAGVPVQIKDVMCTENIRTTCSSRMLEDFVPPYSATVVERLYAKGSVLVGKGNMDEFAMGSSTENSAFYPTRNPWNMDRVPGGSSGGTASAVAAGEAIFGLGSDTGGSIRQPAALCGIVALKPTYGLVSRYGLIAFASSLDQIGPMTRDVRDAAIVLNAIAGHDAKDATSISANLPDYTSELGKDIRGLKLGVPREYFAEGTQPGVSEAMNKALKVLEGLGAKLEEVSLPTTKYALACYYIIAPSECSANLARYDGVKYGYSHSDSGTMWEGMEKTRQVGFGPEVKRRIMLGTYALSSGYYDAFYIKAQRVRTLIRREMEEAYKKFDALVTPTSPTVAFKLGERTQDPVQMYLSDICTIPINMAGIPAISVPCGFSEGMPVGMQIMGPVLSEPLLLRIAYAYEQATAWHKDRPRL
ncbi:MAG: Asp-tRNA(Asn)/Glu-tRNA(Gln) amidotransferase subunit GatA [SAR202 cluster bacterium]|nr:Asp-tRNA(Asn)/Glu-tRNA(Gln) amidotransferase subunit GatA [SAR202 cluster bacterium]